MRAAWRARNCAARFMARRKDSGDEYLLLPRRSVTGDIDKGFAESDLVFEDTFRFQKVQHYSLEAHINIAYYDGEKLTMWSSCQDPLRYVTTCREFFTCRLAGCVSSFLM